MHMNAEFAASFYGLARDSLFGRLVYYFSGKQLFQLDWDKDNYRIPSKYTDLQPGSPVETGSVCDRVALGDSVNGFGTETRPDKLDDSKEKDVVVESSRTEEKSICEKFSEGKIIVTWDGEDDPMKPQNWPGLKKLVVLIVISLCTSSLYMGAAIYTPASADLQKEYSTTRVRITLGLSLFLYGYGIGSLWFSPMSENPIFGGRNYIYLGTQLVFACLQIPTALVNHVAPFAVLRLLGGIMASPCLSTGGASMADFMPVSLMPHAIIFWTFGAIACPSLSPLIGGALVQLHGSRYPFWFMLGLSGGMLVMMFLILPETSESALLMRKAKSLRTKTGNPNILAPGDLVAATQTTRQVLKHIFWLPIELCMREYVLLLMNIHIGLMYSVMYLYFEAFPLAYGEVYGFNLVQQGLAYISLLVGTIIAAPLYLYYVSRENADHTHPERLFGPPAILSSILFPAGMLIFGWSVSRHIHWAVSMIGNVMFGSGAYVISQSYFAFIGNIYIPEIAGSAFASNSLIRSLMAGSFPLFGTVMYERTSTPRFIVGWGCTIIALLAFMFLPLPIYLLKRGEKLRARAQEKYGGNHHRT